MRQVLFFLLVLLTAQFANAQSVGIGTTTPNSNSILDLTSSSKAFLPPRMTNGQRLAISPSVGMIVYDSTVHRLYYRDDIAWRAVIDNSYWTRSSAGIYNQTDNIGIGTSNPNASAALHINSATRGFLPPSMTSTQRTNISSPAEGLMVYDNTVNRLYQYQGSTWRTILNNEYWSLSGTDLYSNSTLNVGIGNANPLERLHVSGNIKGTGDLILSGEITMNNPTGTLQFQSASVNKGYVQISGDNLRMGTNSGNSTGNLIIRMNGNDRVHINSAGDINLDGKITTPNTGTVNMLPLCFGLINSDGTILGGSGNFTVTKGVTGFYSINCTGITDKVVVVAMAHSTTRIVTGGYLSPNAADIIGYYVNTGGDADVNFSFIIYKGF